MKKNILKSLVFVFIVVIAIGFLLSWIYSMNYETYVNNSNNPLFTKKFNIDDISKYLQYYKFDDDSVRKDFQTLQTIQSYANKYCPDYPKYTYQQLFQREDLCKSKCIYDWILKDYQNRFQWNDKGIISEISEVYFDDVLQVKDLIKKERPEKWSEKLHIQNFESPLKLESAKSYAMPSGHAILGLLFGFYLYKLHKEYFDNNDMERKSLARRCFGIGVRRIIGGVHFPDDIRGALMYCYLVMQNTTENTETEGHFQGTDKMLEEYYILVQKLDSDEGIKSLLTDIVPTK